MDKKMKHIIRKLKSEDYKSVTHVITVAWNETYKGIVPDEILNNMYLNEDERIEKSIKGFN